MLMLLSYAAIYVTFVMLLFRNRRGMRYLKYSSGGVAAYDLFQK